MTGNVPSKTEHGGYFVKILLLFIVAITAAASTKPMSFHMPGIGLDQSWPDAALYATRHKLAFGSEFAFTSGPFSPLYTRLFPLEITPLVLVISLLWAAIFARLLYQASLRLQKVNERLFYLYIFLLGISAQFFLFDGIILFVIYGICVLYLRKEVGPAFLALTIIAAGAFCTAKFSFLVFALPACLILDAASVLRKELPYKSALLLLSMFALFVACGQSPFSFPDYIKASLEIAAGYSAAMNIGTKGVELALWLIAAITLLYLALRKNLTWNQIWEPLLLSGYLFLLLKAGFIRNDGHTLIAWTGTFLAIPLIGPAGHETSLNRGRIAFSMMLCAFFLFKISGVTPRTFQAFQPIKEAASQSRRVLEVAVHPRAWMDEMTNKFSKAEQEIDSVSSLPSVNGPVDIIPSRQSEVIAKKLDYRPRPTVQEYSTYSANLIRRNREFYESDRAPEFVLFAPGSIDDRHPASAEGALWPFFLQNYKPVGGSDDIVTLQKRKVGVQNILQKPILIQSGIDEPVRIPAFPPAIFVKIDVEYSLAGKILAVFFKPPLLRLKVIYQDGTSQNYRVIPEMAREGAILVPTIETADDFRRLYTNSHIDRLKRPTTFQFAAGKIARLAYKSTVSFSFSGLDLNSISDASTTRPE